MQFVCPSCEEEFVYAIPRDEAGKGETEPLECPGCGLVFETPAPGGDDPATSRNHAVLDRCRICGNTEFYVQKDFNRQLGFMIALTSFLIIFLIMLRWGHLVGIYCLFALALVDWVIYLLLRDVQVCYLCQSVYRNMPRNPDHKGFYLGSEEKYKRLRGEWVKTLRRRS